jgi:hypothetical protein
MPCDANGARSEHQRGQSLPRADVMGKCDPSVTVSFFDQKFTSDVLLLARTGLAAGRHPPRLSLSLPHHSPPTPVRARESLLL